MASQGMLQSGNTLAAVADAHTHIFAETSAKMARIVFEAGSERDSDSRVLEAALVTLRRALSDNLRQFLQKNTWASKTRAIEAAGNRFELEAERMLPAYVDDFRNGMLEGKRMTKGDPVLNIITNSPGALQQIGNDNVQSVIQAGDGGAALREVLAAFLRSSEVASLTADQQRNLADVAEVVSDEVSKPKPDPGRIQRWGRRLLSLASDFGVQVAATGVAKALFG
jgi:hypothetical protein